MTAKRRSAGLGFSLVASWLVAGCGPSTPAGVQAQPDSTLALSEVGEMYRTYEAQYKKPPTKIQDFQGMRAAYSSGMRSLGDGSVVAQWGVMLSDLSEGGGGGDSGDEVLAYEKGVPEKGGQVLMKNRRVKTMTAEQFKAAPKAGGSK